MSSNLKASSQLIQLPSDYALIECNKFHHNNQHILFMSFLYLNNYNSATFHHTTPTQLLFLNKGPYRDVTKRQSQRETV